MQKNKQTGAQNQNQTIDNRIKLISKLPKNNPKITQRHVWQRNNTYNQLKAWRLDNRADVDVGK